MVIKMVAIVLQIYGFSVEDALLRAERRWLDASRSSSWTLGDSIGFWKVCVISLGWIEALVKFGKPSLGASRERMRQSHKCHLL